MGRLARTILASRVVPAGCQPLRRGAGDIGLGVVPHHQHPRWIRALHQLEGMLENGCRRLGHLYLVRDHQRLEPLVPAQLVEATALRQAETVGDDPHLHLALQHLQGLHHPLQWHAQGDDLLQEGIVHRHRRHVHLFGKQGEAGLLQVGGINLAGVVLLPEPVVESMVLRHLGRGRRHAVNVQRLFQRLGDREIEQCFVQIEQHPVITWYFHGIPYCSG